VLDVTVLLRLNHYEVMFRENIVAKHDRTFYTL
jgi:hypothetical protein